MSGRSRRFAPAADVFPVDQFIRLSHRSYSRKRIKTLLYQRVRHIEPLPRPQRSAGDRFLKQSDALTPVNVAGGAITTVMSVILVY